MQPRQFLSDISLFHRQKYLTVLDEGQKEVLCEFQFDDAAIKDMQKNIATDLIVQYATKPATGYNLEKIEKFQDIITENKKDTSLTAWFAQLSGQSWAFFIQSWFTSFRLFLLRSNRISIFSGTAPATAAFSWFVYAIKIGGLSYLLSLSFDIGIIVYETFFREKSARENAMDNWECAWERFKSIMMEDDPVGGIRLYRMANDGLWVAINAVGIFMTGPLLFIVNASINVAGFAFDVCNEFVLGLFLYYKYASVTEKLATIIEEQKYHLRQHAKIAAYNETQLEHYIHDVPRGYEQFLTDEDCKMLRVENQKLQTIKDIVDVKRIEVRNKYLRIIFSLSLVVVAMVLCFFPPTTMIGAAILGADMALVFGSITAGLGPRLLRIAGDLYDKAVKYFSPEDVKPDPDGVSPDSGSEEISLDSRSEKIKPVAEGVVYPRDTRFMQEALSPMIILVTKPAQVAKEENRAKQNADNSTNQASFLKNIGKRRKSSEHRTISTKRAWDAEDNKENAGAKPLIVHRRKSMSAV